VHSCEEENLNIVAAVARASELRTIQATVTEVMPESSTRKYSARAFKPTEDTKVEQVDPEDTSKTVRIGCGLFDRQERELINFSLQNRDIFAWKPSDMPGILRQVADHSLDILPGSKPIKQCLHRFNDKRQKAIGEEIASLLAAGLIKEVFHPDWIANPVLVRKKNETWRMCVDYTNLNKACPKVPYPLP
jgi:hypothetical protein